MAIAGTEKVDLDLGPIHPQDCETCGVDRPFRLRLSYQYEHLFGLGNLRRKSYVIVCDECKTAYRVTRQQAFRLGNLTREPIPFITRYGCMLVFLPILAFVAIKWLMSMK
jgi:hypothetical protein